MALSKREQSLLDFVGQYNQDRYAANTNLDRQKYPSHITSINPSINPNLNQETGLNRIKAKSQYFTGEMFQNDEAPASKKWNYANINRIPAQYVGGPEGEYRYYGLGKSHPLMNHARGQVQSSLAEKPYYNVEDSIPTSEALYYEDLWGNK